MRLLWLLLLALPALAQPSPGWLNVRDFGATGSSFETRATTTAGSPQVEVAELGDLAVGQAVIVSRCHIRYARPTIWGPAEPYSSAKPIKDQVEFRGYDGSAGSWVTYLLEIDGANPLTLRWSDDLARTWKATKVPVTGDWQKLSGGVEVRLNKHDWQPGHMITFSARDQLTARIRQIDGRKLTLDQPANRSATDAVLRHCDGPALQAAVDRALKDKHNLWFPPGHYRLASSIRVNSPAALTLQGAGAEQVTLDISDGEGPVFGLYGGTEVTVRDFRMVGHTGRQQAAGAFRTSSGFGFWACALRGCNAVSIVGSERVLIENVHARRMASEAFYSQGPGRAGASEPKAYTKAITYLRCSVEDCAANAFNNNDIAENTSVLQCRIVDVGQGGWHAWEGPSRFIRIQGNYIRNAGPVTVGDMSHRYPHLNELGCGQAIVSGNVFEGTSAAGGISVSYGSSQVVISDNLFVNYNGTAIRASSATEPTCFPAHSVVIKNNVIDLTHAGEGAYWRTGIDVSTDQTIVANNQVYCRVPCGPNVNGIRVSEPALNVDVHDNLIRGCGRGLITGRCTGRVTEVTDDRTFKQAGVPLQWQVSHHYRGWRLVRLTGARANTATHIDEFDAETLRFRCREPHELKPGDRFEVHPPDGPNWTLARNTITDCLVPVVLDSWGGPAARFDGNTIVRGAVTGVKTALELRGRFALTGNRIVGFDEADSAALGLFADRLGQAPGISLRDNVIRGCGRAVAEERPGLWRSAERRQNTFVDCRVPPPGEGAEP